MKYEKKKDNQRIIAKIMGIATMVLLTIVAYVGAYVFISSDKFFALYGIWFDFQKDMVKFFVPMIGIIFSIAGYVIWFNSVINDDVGAEEDNNDDKPLGYGWQYWALVSAVGGGLISIIALLLCKAGVPFISPTFVWVWIVQAISVFIAFAWKVSNPLNKTKN